MSPADQTRAHRLRLARRILGAVLAGALMTITAPSQATDTTSMPLVYNDTRGGGVYGPGISVEATFDYYTTRPMSAVAFDLRTEGFTCAYITDVGWGNLPPARIAEHAAALRAGGIEPVLRLYATTDFGLYQAHPEWRQRSVAGVDGQFSWRVYLCPNEPGYVAAQCQRLQDVMSLGQFRAFQVAEPWFEQWGGPEDEYGNPREAYSCVCGACINKFRDIAGIDAMEMLTSPTSALYFRRPENAAVYAQWVDFRVDSITSFTSALCDAARETTSGAVINVMCLSDARVEPGLVREYQGIDLDRLVGDIMPDILTIQDAWQDWLDPTLPPDFIADYAAQYRDRVHAIKPDIYIMSHADIGSAPESRRSRVWIHEFAAATLACGFDAPSFYEWSISRLAEPASATDWMLFE